VLRQVRGTLSKAKLHTLAMTLAMAVMPSASFALTTRHLAACCTATLAL
jgi:hypothetical protein